MPLPLLAAAVPAATSAATAATGATIGAIGGAFQSLANNDLQRRNKAMLDALLQREQRGALGLSANEQRMMNEQLRIVPQAQATASRREAERLLGSREVSPGDLAVLRQQEAAQRAGIAQDAAMQVRAADEAKAQQERQVIEQRLQAKAAMRADDWNTVLGSAADGARVAGAGAGAPPGTMPGTLTGLFGLPAQGSAPAAAPAVPALSTADATRVRSQLDALYGKAAVDAMLRAAASASTMGTGAVGAAAVR